MSFVSVAQAAQGLGIDAKTLHRWLAEAQLALQSHPQDGRKKGLSREHLHLLAHLHQRSLAPLSPPSSALAQGEELQLAAALLALPERLDALQTQLAALQQQVRALTHLLQSHLQAPALPPAQATPSRTTRPAPPPAAARVRPTATTPRKPVHVIPRVEYVSEGHYVVIDPKRGLLPFEPETPEWFAWLTSQSSFRFVGARGSFSAHHKARVPKGAWRAHRKIRNRVYVQRLAPSQELTMAVLEQAAAALQVHLK